MVQVFCLKKVRAYEKGEEPKKAEEVPDMDEFSKQLLSRAPDGPPSNLFKAAVEDTLIITMKGVRLCLTRHPSQQTVDSVRG